jgi:hypothetical protein
VVQQLPPFFSAVGPKEAQWLVSENNYYSRQYGLQLCSSGLQARLAGTKRAANKMAGTCWYDILANQAYVQAFAYTDTTTRLLSPSEAAGQSDLVSLCLNHALLDEKR